jgi:hypothetical protein
MAFGMKVNMIYFKGTYNHSWSASSKTALISFLYLSLRCWGNYIMKQTMKLPLWKSLLMGPSELSLVTAYPCLPGYHYWAVLVDNLIESKLQGLILCGLEFDSLRSEGVKERDVVVVIR